MENDCKRNQLVEKYEQIQDAFLQKKKKDVLLFIHEIEEIIKSIVDSRKDTSLLKRKYTKQRDFIERKIFHVLTDRKTCVQDIRVHINNLSHTKHIYSRDLDLELRYISAIKEIYPNSTDFINLEKEQKKKMTFLGKSIREIATKFGRTNLYPDVFFEDLLRLTFYIYGDMLEISDIHMKRQEDRKQVFKERYDAETFMNLTWRQRQKIKIYGRKLSDIAKIMGLHYVLPEQNKAHAAVLAKEIYGEGIQCIEVELLSRQDWIDKIKAEYPLSQDLKELIYNSRKIKIEGKGFRYIGIKILGKQISNLSKPVMAEIVREVYDTIDTHINVERWEKQDWIDMLKSEYQTSQDFMNLAEKAREVKIHGKGLLYIGRIILGKRISNLSKPVLAEIASHIYRVLEISVDVELWDKKKWREEIRRTFPTVDDFMQITKSEKRSFKIGKKGLSYISGVFGVQEDVINNQKALAKLANKIYPRNTSQYVQVAFWEEQDWRKEIQKLYPTKKDFLVLNSITREEVKIGFKGLKYISNTVFGGTGKLTNKKFQELADKIYDSDKEE